MKDRVLYFDELGNFMSPNPVRLSKKVIGLRLPVDIVPLVYEVAGSNVSSWIREAVFEKLDRETSQKSA